MPGEHFDSYDSNESQASPAPKAFVGVRFECCSVYRRVYKNTEGTAYEGKCPRCAKPVRLRVGAGGVSARFFTAY